MQALGNHEFDNNIEGLLPFLQNVNFTILSSNINLDSDPRIKPYVKKSYVTEVGGEKIGVIGYTTKDTPMISQPGKQHLKGVGQCFFLFILENRLMLSFAAQGFTCPVGFYQAAGVCMNGLDSRPGKICEILRSIERIIKKYYCM